MESSNTEAEVGGKAEAEAEASVAADTEMKAEVNAEAGAKEETKEEAKEEEEEEEGASADADAKDDVLPLAEERYAVHRQLQNFVQKLFTQVMVDRTGLDLSMEPNDATKVILYAFMDDLAEKTGYAKGQISTLFASDDIHWTLADMATVALALGVVLEFTAYDVDGAVRRSVHGEEIAKFKEKSVLNGLCDAMRDEQAATSHEANCGSSVTVIQYKSGKLN